MTTSIRSESHQNPGLKAYQCDMCSKTFSGSTGLSRHKITIHSSIEINCPTCGQTFHRSDHMKAHQGRVHEGIKYSCEKCEISYASKKGLQIHVERDHLGLTFKCDCCNQEFPNRLAVVRHKRYKQATKNGPNHPCDFCEKSYFSSQRLNDHKE